jgi:hypothetical protein
VLVLKQQTGMLKHTLFAGGIYHHQHVAEGQDIGKSVHLGNAVQGEEIN